MNQKAGILYRTDKEVFVAITETIWVATRNFFRPMYILGEEILFLCHEKMSRLYGMKIL